MTEAKELLPTPGAEPDRRAERREEIKLILEYAKLAISFFGFAGIIFAALQWRASNSLAQQSIMAANEGTYQRMASEWREHIQTFIERPGVRPYFEDNQPIKPDAPDRNLILAVADVRLDVMDAVGSYAHIQGFTIEEGWTETFIDVFRKSSVLCDRLRDVGQRYGPTLRGYGAAGCAGQPPKAR